MSGRTQAASIITGGVVEGLPVQLVGLDD